MIVADNNLVVYLFVESPYADEAQEVLRRDREWVVPPLWQSEFLNALLGHLRQGTLSEEGVFRHFLEAETIVHIAEPPPAREVLSLAVQHGLSAYDATYAALADHLGVLHITYDRQVLRAGLGTQPGDFLR